jgi:putative endonuclease
MLFRTKMPTLAKGSAAEALAEEFLVREGLRTQCKNFRCRAGEIDLIMQHRETLVFVEVRLRSNTQFCSAAESVDRRKQQKIMRAAQLYLQQKNLTDAVPCRFDVIALSHVGSSAPEWIQNAFGS